MITYEIISRVGGRDHNEDYAAVLERDGDYCFALADGLGGHGKGEVASRLAVDAVLQNFGTGDNLETGVAACFEQAQNAVMEEQKRQNSFSQMKTTLTVLQIVAGKVIWGHVGDTRLYYFYKKRLQSRTLDHSVPQMLVAAGELKEKEIRHHEDRNRLLRVIGVPWERRMYELSEAFDMRGKEAFLLCSDGWWEWVDEKQMVRCLRQSSDAAEWLDRMEEMIRQQGNGVEQDNYSAIGVLIT